MFGVILASIGKIVYLSPRYAGYLLLLPSLFLFFCVFLCLLFGFTLDGPSFLAFSPFTIHGMLGFIARWSLSVIVYIGVSIVSHEVSHRNGSVIAVGGGALLLLSHQSGT